MTQTKRGKKAEKKEVKIVKRYIRGGKRGQRSMRIRRHIRKDKVVGDGRKGRGKVKKGRKRNRHTNKRKSGRSKDIGAQERFGGIKKSKIRMKENGEQE